MSDDINNALLAVLSFITMVYLASTPFSPPPGLMGGCAAQKELHAAARGGTSGKPGSPDGRPKQSREAGRTNPRRAEGEDEDGRVHRNKAESTCTYTRPPDMLEVR